jgi:CRISPR system Cascade subunit CasD
MKTILLKFAGPLQSWGTSSHYETRETDRYPSKSAVIGMLAAALGYRRENHAGLSRLSKLDFAVRMDQPGKILRDFQIATSHKPNGELLRSYVTNRYYLQDAVNVVAIGSSDDELMAQIFAALKAPYFQLYLGRRALPINADYLLGMQATDVMESLKQLTWQAAKWYQDAQKIATPLAVYADKRLVEKDIKYTQSVKDVPLSFAQGATQDSEKQLNGRRYRSRPVGLVYVDVKSGKMQVEHDALAALGG